MTEKTREDIIAEVRSSVSQSINDWFLDRETGKFYSSEGKDLGFAFFPEKRLFINSEGYHIELRRVNMQTVANFTAAYDKKYAPKVPLKRIKVDENEYYSEGNINDPAYQDELHRHDQAKEIAQAAYQFSLAVKNPLPPRSEWDDVFAMAVEALQALSDEPLKDYSIRYEWINAMLPTNTELVVFVQIVMGAELPTVEALRKAESRFPSEHGANGHKEVSA